MIPGRRRDLRTAGAVLLAALTLIGAQTVPAQAASPHLVNEGIWRCIGVAGDYYGTAGLWDCTENADQIWNIQYYYYNGEAFFIQNDNGRCLTNRYEVGTKVAITTIPCDSTNVGTAELWRWGDKYHTNNRDYYHIINVDSGLALGTAGGSTANGTNLVQYTPLTGHPDQYWYFGPA